MARLSGAPSGGLTAAQDAKLSAIPTTAMRGTDNAALASVVGALADAAAAGVVTETDTVMAYVKQLVTAMLDVQKDAEYAEEHQHHRVVWYGKKSDQATNWCDQATLTPYRATSGDNAWGTEGTDPAKVISSADTLSEIKSGVLQFDTDEILVVANSSNSLYRCRLVWGTGTLADAITAKQFTEFVYSRTTSDTTRMQRRIACPLIAAGNNVWLVIWNATNDATLDFMIGVHGYDF